MNHEKLNKRIAFRPPTKPARTFTPDEHFWKRWKKYRRLMQTQGYYLRKLDNGDWIALQQYR
jgi:hypothetical protein